MEKYYRGMHHFLICISENKACVKIWERYTLQTKDEQVIDYSEDIPKAEILYDIWKMIEAPLREEVKKRKILEGYYRENPNLKKWTKREISVIFLESCTGKEACLLFWAVEHVSRHIERIGNTKENLERIDGTIQKILKNFLGLAHENRWWLYGETNRNGGHMDRIGSGWRQAIFYALSENPTS